MQKPRPGFKPFAESISYDGNYYTINTSHMYVSVNNPEKLHITGRFLSEQNTSNSLKNKAIWILRLFCGILILSERYYLIIRILDITEITMKCLLGGLFFNANMIFKGIVCWWLYFLNELVELYGTSTLVG